MVVVSILLHSEFRRKDHREGAPHFTISFSDNSCDITGSGSGINRASIISHFTIIFYRWPATEFKRYSRLRKLAESTFKTKNNIEQGIYWLKTDKKLNQVTDSDKEKPWTQTWTRIKVWRELSIDLIKMSDLAIKTFPLTSFGMITCLRCRFQIVVLFNWGMGDLAVHRKKSVPNDVNEDVLISKFRLFVSSFDSSPIFVN